MKKINFNSGDFNTNNDGLSFSVAMDPDSVSTLIIRSINGTGFFSYITESDYIYNVKRISFFDDNERNLNPSKSNLIGYPDSFNWVPGQRSSSLSNSREISEEFRVPGGSYWSGGYLITGTGGYFPQDVVMDGVLEGNTIIVQDMFQGDWSGASTLEISDLSSEGSNIPFIDIEKNKEDVCVFNMYSSSDKGSMFSLKIKPDITTELSQEISAIPETRRIYPIYIGDYSERNLIKEWNSLFRINENSNADSTFDTGEIRDAVYSKEMEYFINKNWDGMMRDFLWKDSVENIGDSLSTNQPVKLKKVILSQLLNHGASDDIHKMVKYQSQEARLGDSMKWHIGLGGTTKLGFNKRYLKKEYSFIAALNKSIEFNKVLGLPLRSVVVENITSDKKLSLDPGEAYIESPKNINGYYPLYLSVSMAEKLGTGLVEEFMFNDKKYYMPQGLIENKTFFLGNYDPKTILYNNIVEAETVIDTSVVNSDTSSEQDSY